MSNAGSSSFSCRKVTDLELSARHMSSGDWCALDDPEINYPYGGTKKGWGSNHRIMLPPYHYNKKHYMYISGGFWIAKKYVMEKEPLNESLDWGESEDIEWSKRVLPKYNYKINTYSSVKSLKYKKLSAEYLEY